MTRCFLFPQVLAEMWLYVCVHASISRGVTLSLLFFFLNKDVHYFFFFFFDVE